MRFSLSISRVDENCKAEVLMLKKSYQVLGSILMEKFKNIVFTLGKFSEHYNYRLLHKNCQNARK